jgi:nucleoside-diphosphate-sugar epimerase
MKIEFAIFNSGLSGSMRRPMKILITGGSGFIGSNLSEYLLSGGIRFPRSADQQDQNRIRHEDFRYIEADTTRPGKWQKEVGEAEAVVNLTGATIFKRWTAK